MKKIPFKLCIIFIFLNFSCAEAQDEATDTINKNNEEVLTPVKKHGELKIAGKSLLNADDEPVQLKGMSLFWSQWMPQFYNAETVQSLYENWDISVIRAAMAIEHDGYLDNPQKEKQKVMEVIDAAIDLGIYVIIDWHDHHAEDHLEEAKVFFGEIAKKYGDYPNIIYETYNEPLEVSWSDVLKPYHEAVIAEIRKYDSNNIIVCGTPTWSQRVDKAAEDPIEGVNIAYTLHYYAGTHRQELRDITLKALNKNLPIFVTEYGTTPASGDGNVDAAESKLWWNFLDTHNISWCNWSITDKEEASAAVKPGTLPSELHKESILTESGELVKAELQK